MGDILTVVCPCGYESGSLCVHDGPCPTLEITNCDLKCAVSTTGSCASVRRRRRGWSTLTYSVIPTCDAACGGSLLSRSKSKHFSTFNALRSRTMQGRSRRKSGEV